MSFLIGFLHQIAGIMLTRACPKFLQVTLGDWTISWSHLSSVAVSRDEWLKLHGQRQYVSEHQLLGVQQ